MSVAPSDKWWAHAGRNDDFPDFTLIDTADAESEVQGAAVDWRGPAPAPTDDPSAQAL